ncbi:MAG: Na(+)/H(+) antiporter subunit B [Gammaproteobacteria bacterium RIFCSPHIGHO2_12_FULL_41_15]|nr:MAG: Na(+)/H(+) antiporter subunit B [Gammaproteobacteria bacterium RIFCSPHIGHO2_12_FULL_41_15]
MTSLILRTASRFLLVLMLLFSLWVLLRGHHLPGGGFIAGLIAASAFALYLISHGPQHLRKLIKVHLSLVLASGLTCLLVSGLVGAISKKPFLTSMWIMIKPWYIELGTPLLFDVGIYLIVVSSLLMILLALEESPL